MNRTCVCCNKEQALNKKHFKVVKSFKDGYSYCCLTCDKENKKVEKQGNFDLYTDEKINALRDRLAHQMVWEQGVIE